MASSLPSLEALGSPAKPGSSVIHLCMSVKRTVSGSVSGCLSVRAMAISSVLSQSNVAGIFAPQEEDWRQRRADESVKRTSPAFSVIGFLGVILVPFRNFHDDVGGAVRHGLAAEA